MGLEEIRRQLARSPQGGLSRIRDDLRRRKEIRKLEEDVGVDQEGTVLERATRTVLGHPFVKGVLDVVSRPNYAIAGAYEEIASSRGFLSAGQRIATELFSGIGDLQGEKQAFGEVFEDLGFGAGGSVSDVIPGIFSETGAGVKFQRGGFFDWTARGSLGLALDIVADPTTYLTLGVAATGRQSVRAGAHFLSKRGVKSLGAAFDDGIRKGLSQVDADKAARAFVAQQIDRGAKTLADQGGIKLFGVTLVPGEVFSKPAKSVNDGLVKFLHKSSLGEGIIEIGEGIGRIFNRDFLLRKFPEAIARKQLYLTTMDNNIRALRDTIEDLYRGTTQSQRESVSNFLDNPKANVMDPLMAPHVKKNADIYSEWARIEQELGILDIVRLDYVFHAYDASPKKVKEILARFDQDALRASLKGSQKRRAFNTMDEAEKALAEAGIKPIRDAAELLLRRGMRHIHGVETKKYFTDIANRWGIRALDDQLETGAKVMSEMNSINRSVQDDLIHGVGAGGPTPKRPTTGVTDAEIKKVKAMARKGGTKIEDIRKLTIAGQKLFLQKRFARVQNARELENVISKYGEFSVLFPETTNKATRKLKSHIGEGMAEIPDLPEFKGVALPIDMANDLVNFNKSFIDRKEVSGLLRAYDKFMNSFKVGVTSIFPAFHFRNAYSNLVQQFTDMGLTALNPAIHQDSIRMLAGDVSGSFTAKHGRVWGYGEVAYEAKRRGVIADYRNIFETFGDKIPIRTGGSKLANFVLHPIDTWKRFGGIIENEGRLAAFSNYLRRGLDPETAAQRVNKVLFDYKNLSKVERDVLARAFPFYRWMRKNIALQAERLAKNPGQAAIQAKLTKQNSTDPNLLPSYLRGEFVFTLEADNDGKLTFIRGLDLPINELNILDGPLQQLVGNLAPMPKILLELSTDRDFFRRRSISETSTPLIKGLGPILDKLPQVVKKKIQFNKKTLNDGTTEYRMNPTMTYVIIKSWALSRIYGTAERVMRAKSLVSKENFLDLGTGIRLQDVDVDVRMDSLEREYRSFLEHKAVSRGIRRRFQRTFTPKDETVKPRLRIGKRKEPKE